MRLLVLDNYDSFTYNLVQYVEKILNQKVDVYRNDKILLDDVNRYDKIILSPGPGIPDEAGILKALIKKYSPTKSILGVCLGHQAIGEVFGAKLINMNKVYHGVSTPVMFMNGNEPIFKGLPKQINAGRYHSWLVDNKNIPECLEITALDENGQIMAMRHKQFNVTGVQFHPESVLTEHGEQIMRNWLEK